jgi:hypothetical protein
VMCFPKSSLALILAGFVLLAFVLLREEDE